MQTYKATNGVTSYLKKFADLATAQAYFLPILGDTYTVSLAPPSEQIPNKTAVQILSERQVFGATLQQTFVLDNAPYAPTKAQAKQLLSKLRDAWELCELGSLALCSEELTDVQTDAIFTQARKEKYIQMIADYLASE